MIIYFSLGSNISPRLDYLKNAVLQLKKSGIKIIKLSSVYKTSPVGYKKQPYFLNAVGKGNTRLKPLECLEVFKSIEKQLGRKRRKRFGPREIDIDLLLYGRLNTKSKKLTLPHPRMHLRKFVLIPLLEISPGNKVAAESLQKLHGDDKIQLTYRNFNQYFQ